VQRRAEARRRRIFVMQRVALGAAAFVCVTGLFYAHLFVFPIKLVPGQIVPFTIASPADAEWVDSEQFGEVMKRASEGWVLDPTVAETAVKEVNSFFDDIAILQKSELPFNSKALQLEAKYPPSSLLIKKLLDTDSAVLAEYQTEAVKLLRQQLSSPMDSESVEAIQSNAENIYIRIPEQISAYFLRPNLVSYKSADPEELFRDFFTFKISKGDIIISEGQRVTTQVLDKQKAVKDAQKRQDLLTFSGLSLMFLIMLIIWAYYLHKFKKTLWNAPRSMSVILAIVIFSLLLSLVIMRIPLENAYFAVSAPLIAASIITCVVFDPIFSLYLFGSIALLVSWLFGFNTDLLIYNVVGCVASPVFLSRTSDRRRIIALGFILAAINVYLVGIVILVGVQTLSVTPFIVAAASGIAAAIFALGSQSLLDQFALELTQTKLLELADSNSALLQQMNLKAPGTYNHSVVMAHMAEDAARAVNADPLLAKVGALYHDIGKIAQPQFFAENIHDKSKNPHNRLNPRTSYQIILKHIEAGVELGRRHKLPEEIIDFILTHHGTTVMKYFYQQAVNEEGEEMVSSKEFEYPGPIPFTKETTIVHLADSVEAIVRAREISSEQELSETIKEIFEEKIRTGQLDSSDVSIKDLNAIRDAFTSVLAGIYHSRVKYPEDIAREKRREDGAGAPESTNNGAGAKGG